MLPLSEFDIMIEYILSKEGIGGMKKSDLKRFINIPTLKTERLVLRKITNKDLLDVFEYASDVRVSEYLLWSPHPDKAYTRAYLSLLSKKYRAGEFYDWGIEYRGKIIGTCGFTSFSIEHNVGEIGYVLSSKFWGQGIASEAVRAVIKFGFEVLELNRIEAKFMAENEKSHKLLDKLGLVYEGKKKEAVFAKGIYRDVCISAITNNGYQTKLAQEN